MKIGSGLLAWILLAPGAVAAPLPPDTVDAFSGNPRLVVLTDIGNEPDDQMSLVRLLGPTSARRGSPLIGA